MWCSISSHIWETHFWFAAARQSCKLNDFLISEEKEDKSVKLSKNTECWILEAVLPTSPGTNIPLRKHIQLQLFGTVVSYSVGSKGNVNANDRMQQFTLPSAHWPPHGCPSKVMGRELGTGLHLHLKREKEKLFYVMYASEIWYKWLNSCIEKNILLVLSKRGGWAHCFSNMENVAAQSTYHVLQHKFLCLQLF